LVDHRWQVNVWHKCNGRKPADAEAEVVLSVYSFPKCKLRETAEFNINIYMKNREYKKEQLKNN